MLNVLRVSTGVQRPAGYVSGYTRPKNLMEQTAILRKLFPGLGICDVSPVQQELPNGAEGYFAIPHWKSIAPTYNDAVHKVLNLLSEKAGVRFWRRRDVRLLLPDIRQSAESKAFWGMFSDEQPDIFVVAAQFGIRHRGRSLHRARELMDLNEHILDAFTVGIMLLTHEKRLRHRNDLGICTCDEVTLPDDVPCFQYAERGLRLETFWSHLDGSRLFGYASGWTAPRKMIPIH